MDFFIVTWLICNSNMTSFFRFVNKRAIYRLGRDKILISPGFKFTTLVVICTDCTGSSKSNYHTITTTAAPWIIEYDGQYDNMSCEISHNFRIRHKHLWNKSWKPECVLSFNMGWRILVFCLDPIDKSLVCLQSARRTSC
jgi:hypothetical protein